MRIIQKRTSEWNRLPFQPNFIHGNHKGFCRTYFKNYTCLYLILLQRPWTYSWSNSNAAGTIHLNHHTHTVTLRPRPLDHERVVLNLTVSAKTSCYGHSHDHGQKKYSKNKIPWWLYDVSLLFLDMITPFAYRGNHREETGGRLSPNAVSLVFCQQKTSVDKIVGVDNGMSQSLEGSSVVWITETIKLAVYHLE